MTLYPSFAIIKAQHREIVQKMQPRKLASLIEDYRNCQNKVQRYQKLLHERELLFDQMQTSPQLKINLRKIDCELDEMDEATEEALIKAKNNLLHAFQTDFPERASEYFKQETGFQEQQKEHAALLQTQKQLQPFLAILRHQPQKPKILDYITGKHPKILLAHKIQKAAAHAERALPLIKNEKIEIYLRNFLFETKQRSNNALYKGKFITLAEAFFPLMEALDKQVQLSKSKLDVLEQTLNTWFDSFHNSK